MKIPRQWVTELLREVEVDPEDLRDLESSLKKNLEPERFVAAFGDAGWDYDAFIAMILELYKRVNIGGGEQIDFLISSISLASELD